MASVASAVSKMGESSFVQRKGLNILELIPTHLGSRMRIRPCGRGLLQTVSY